MEFRYHPILEGLKVNEDGSEITFLGEKLEPRPINRNSRPCDVLLIHLNGRTYSVGRLVCEAWHGLAPDIDHNATRIDPDGDFHYTNLFWAKRGVNPHYGRIKFPRQKTSKIPEDAIPQIVERLKNGELLKTIAAEFGTSEMSISRIRKRYINGKKD